MPKLPADAPKSAKKARVRQEMHKFKEGELRSGSKHGPVVTDRAQAIAISLHEANESRKSRKSSRTPSRGGRR